MIENTDVPKVKVTVEFPYRGVFRWGEDSWARLQADPEFQSWDEFLKSTINEWLAGKTFARETIDSADYVWGLLDDAILVDEDSFGELSDDQKLTVLDAMMVPSSRGREGIISFDETDIGFAADFELTQVFELPGEWADREFIAEIYSATFEDVFSFLIEGASGYRLVRNAGEIATRFRIQELDRIMKAEAAVPTAAAVRVWFPLRALFQWDKRTRKAFQQNGFVRSWSRYKAAEVELALNNSPEFRRGKVVQDLDVLLKLMNSIQFRKAGLGWEGMSDGMKEVLIDALMVPGSRGVKGNPGFVDDARTEFFADRDLTQDLIVGYCEDGDYAEEIRKVVGDVMFRYKVMG